MSKELRFLTASDLKEGMRVLHSRFGKGTVVGVDQTTGQELVGVVFDNEEKARGLDVSYAKLLLLEDEN